MASDKRRIHTNYLCTDADSVNNEGIMHNTTKSQSVTGAGLVSSATGSGTFQCYVECDDGIDLYVDLTSTPSDWMRTCSNGLGLPQNLHKRKYRRTSPVEMGVSFPPATAHGAFLKNGFDEFYGSTKGQESLYNNSSKSCLPVLSQPSRAMEEHSLQSGAWENGAMCKNKRMWKEGIDQSSLTCMPARESERRNVEMGFQAPPGICQRGPGNELAVQNQGREIQRSLGVHYPLEETRNEMQCTHQPIENSQVQSQRYISKYNVDYKKSPSVKNLRFLKTLARGPLVPASSVERRRSTRLVDKSP